MKYVPKFIFLISLLLFGCATNSRSQVERSPSKVIDIKKIQEGCDAGRAESCYQLGRMYLAGDKVEQDNYEAVKFFQFACDGDILASCSDLGIMYAMDFGVPVQDDQRAFSLFQRACDGGVVVSGCGNLAVMYEKGRGTDQNYEKAIELYRLGCENKNDLNCYNLGHMYENGNGIERNNAQASYFYSKACGLKYQKACDDYYRLLVVPGT